MSFLRIRIWQPNSFFVFFVEGEVKNPKIRNQKSHCLWRSFHSYHMWSIPDVLRVSQFDTSDFPRSACSRRTRNDPKSDPEMEPFRGVRIHENAMKTMVFGLKSALQSILGSISGTFSGSFLGPILVVMSSQLTRNLVDRRGTLIQVGNYHSLPL